MRTTILSAFPTVITRRNSSSMVMITNNRSIPEHSSVRSTYLDFSKLKKVSDASVFFDYMIKIKPLPNAVQFTMLLNLVLKMEDYALALCMFNKIRHLRVPLDTKMLNVAINCCSLARSSHIGFGVLSIFVKSGLKPDACTFNTLIRGLFLDNKLADAQKLFHKLRKEKVFELNAITHNVVIHGLCKSGNTRTALGLLRQFEKGRCKPDVGAYNIVIDSLCKDGMVNVAMEVFYFMISCGVEPDTYTYTIIIDAYGKMGRVECSHACLAHMILRGVNPNSVTYLALLDGYCSVGKMELARKIFHLVMNFSRDIKVYNTLMKGYCKVGDVEQALGVYYEIPRVGLVRTKISHTIILDCLFHAGRCEEAMEIFSEMQEHDVIACNAVVDGLCKNKKTEEAFSLLHMMQDSGITPDITTYNILIHGVFGDGQVDTAMNIFNSLPSKGLQTNIRTHNIVIRGFCKMGYLDEAKLHFMEMEKFGCPPDRITYNILLKAHLGQNEQV